MTAGENRLFELMDTTLDNEWEIYIQPHLNGLRPDFVLLNPKVGVVVIEVKDWDLNAMAYDVRRYDGGRVELVASKDGRTFRVDNPFQKIRRYKDAIFNIYCPRLQARFGYAAIAATVVFPFASQARVKSLQLPFLKDEERAKAASYWPVAGEEQLRDLDVRAMFPVIKHEASRLMTPAIADDLRGWLVEPDFAREQREPLQLDRNQRSLADSRTESGFRRIRGPAGSGKSLVLAARAARLADEGKDVLIVTFNMTLWHYLRDLVAREVKKKGYLSRLTFVHFHEWCKDVCNEAGFEEEYALAMQPITKVMKLKLPPREEALRLKPVLPKVMNEAVPYVALEAARSGAAAKYDAVLVDEGQDYLPLWWNALREICKPGGEMWLAADVTQDIYGTAKNWTEAAMVGAGFPGGRWAQLDVSYRMPPDALRMARDFTRRFLPGETSVPPALDQSTLDLFPCDIRWVQTQDPDSMRQCVNEILTMMRRTGTNGLANADITFLANDIDFGRAVVDELNTYGVRTAHTFEREKMKQNRLKMAFYVGDARVKATTLHSFKGWETRLLVIHIRRAVGAEGMAAIYAGLTRLKRSQEGSFLTVVCSAPELQEFGASWSSQGAN
ncbi:NERD domain-containing protein [Sphingobium sp. HBC34]|jgi:hypothetical protein|uniref:DNA 3'-5' helicase II n=1 Tax=Sphingobium cyanobacteriorum TaxID=3063954 RepID=A0ABT8ZR13_9SPHN|nr:nuclease-related domain-containing DEAD/DEAH box helicase [Sphingobium sp. HBC34]MDO7836898.1 NERD domain-containing protein [Sphingobium sp. HBC34]